MRIAVVEPYHGGSHRAFAEGLARFSAHDVEIFSLRASFWKWRMQGGFVPLAAELTESAKRNGRFDLVLGTSMLDAARFLGAARHAMASTPFVFYMHENQLTYPPAPGGRVDLSFAMTNWVSMTSSDLVLFNSQFHLDTWFGELPGLLRRFPDHRHSNFIDDVRGKAAVLAPGIDLQRIGAPAPRRGRPLILWNQRWEYDKGPDLLVEAIMRLAESGAVFDLALAGEQFVSDPTGFGALRDRLGSRVVHFGYAEDAGYIELLASADIVVSTSLQEFFGIAITEAMYAGSFPVLPRRLVYPERLPTSHHDRCLYDDAEDLVAKLRWAIDHRREAAGLAAELKPVMAAFDWSELAPIYDATFQAAATNTGPPSNVQPVVPADDAASTET